MKSQAVTRLAGVSRSCSTSVVQPGVDATLSMWRSGVQIPSEVLVSCGGKLAKRQVSNTWKMWVRIPPARLRQPALTWA